MSKLKYVYAVVSGKEDYYAEQALVSMYSLRLYNPGCHIVLATDDETLSMLRDIHSPIGTYVSECVTINAPSGFTHVQRSRYVKTLIRKYIKGDFLYLDSDTVITDSLKALENFEGDVAATLFRHIKTWEKGVLPDRLLEFYEKTKIEEKLDFSFFCNGGVVFCKDTPVGHQLFETWHKYWLESSTKYGYDFDQVNLWRANASMGNVMVELNGIYNCQLIYKEKAIGYMGDCKVFHYQITSNDSIAIPFKNPAILEEIRHNGITPKIEEMAKNVKLNYLRKIVLLSGNALEIYNSPVVVLGRKISRDYKWTNKVVRFVYKFFGYEL